MSICNHLQTESRRIVADKGALRWGLALFVCMVAGLAHAKPDPGKANALFKEAKAALEAGDSAKAEKLSTEAAGYFQHPAIFLLQAKSLRLLGKLDQATITLRKINTRKLSKGLKQAWSVENKALEKRRKISGELKLRVRPSTALIEVQGLSGKGGMRRWLVAGKLSVTFSAPGHQTRVEQVQLKAGETESLEIQSNPATGTLIVDVSGGLRDVRIQLDDKP
ncbi:MAG TPA: hypothetical protein DCQ06_01750, partial [Myxococcales bacterium]|nr:hypothetical protein [Myxococcales bacterium]